MSNTIESQLAATMSAANRCEAASPEVGPGVGRGLG